MWTMAKMWDKKQEYLCYHLPGNGHMWLSLCLVLQCLAQNLAWSKYSVNICPVGVRVTTEMQVHKELSGEVE